MLPTPCGSLVKPEKKGEEHCGGIILQEKEHGMKKHQFEVLLQELAASEELPGWQDALHELVVQELATVKNGKAAQEQDGTAD